MHFLSSWIQTHFHTDHFQIVPLEKGISNQNYLLTVDQKKYVLRAPKPGHEHLQVQFDMEKQVLEHVQALDVKTVIFDVQHGIKVTEYVPDCKEFHESKDPYKYEKAAKLLKSLHEQTIWVPHHFEPFKKLMHYKKQTLSPIVHFEQERKTLELARKLYCPQTLCHNDVVQGNILFTSQREYLIDWEYAAMNDWRFDIASFFSENQITDSKNRLQFYKAYAAEINDLEIRLFEALEDILWGYWANLLYEKRKEPIYKQIALEKEAHYHSFSNRK